MRREIKIPSIENNIPDTPLARADLACTLLKQLYDSVAISNVEESKLKGKAAKEIKSLRRVLNVAETHYDNMLTLATK